MERISDELVGLMDRLQEVIYEEQDAYDNLPEGIQESERGEQMEEFISQMEDAYSNMEDANDYIMEVYGA